MNGQHIGACGQVISNSPGSILSCYGSKKSCELTSRQTML